MQRIDLRQLNGQRSARTMGAMRTWVLGLLVCTIAACGVVEAPPAVEPSTPRSAAEVGPELELEQLEACAAMDCDVLIGDICPVCGTPELTCECYKLKRDGSEEVGVPCAPPAGSMTCR